MNFWPLHYLNLNTTTTKHDFITQRYRIFKERRRGPSSFPAFRLPTNPRGTLYKEVNYSAT